MSQNEFHQLQLQINLSQYGLNPKEWSLRKISKFTVLISNKEDPGFRLQGRWKNHKRKALWENVKLISV